MTNEPVADESQSQLAERVLGVVQGIAIDAESNPEAFTPANYAVVITDLAKTIGLEPKESGLPHRASEVIQEIINRSGHQLSLADLLAIAHCMGAGIQLYITDWDEMDVPKDVT